MGTVIHLLQIVRALMLDRERLVLENAALRHQVAVLKRTTKRPQLTPIDRAFWVFLRTVFNEWKDALHIVQPETVVRWHREGFRLYWR